MTSILYIDGGGPVEVEFVDLHDAGTVLAGGGTVSSVPFGDAASGRKIVIAVHAFSASGGDPVLTAATIGGVTASIFTGDALTPDTIDPSVWLIAAEVPSGTSGNVGLTFSDAVGVYLGIWRMTDAESLTSTDTPGLVVFGSTTSSQSVNIDVEERGVQFAAASVLHAGGTESFTAGISIPDYIQQFGTGDGDVMGGFELITADEANRVATIAMSGGGNWRGVFATVSFR